MNAMLVMLSCVQMTGAPPPAKDSVAIGTCDAASVLVAPLIAGLRLPENQDDVLRADLRWSGDPVDTLHKRPRAIQHDDAYYTRLKIHRIGSYAMLPLFAAEYALGQELLNGTNPPGWVRPAHGAVAGGLGVLFTVNTVTGAWNLWDARHDEAGRTRRNVHTVLMLASDAGFAWAGAIAGAAHNSSSAAQRHRNVAIGSMALSTAGTALMWFWKD